MSRQINLLPVAPAAPRLSALRALGVAAGVAIGMAGWWSSLSAANERLAEAVARNERQLADSRAALQALQAREAGRLQPGQAAAEAAALMPLANLSREVLEKLARGDIGALAGHAGTLAALAKLAREDVWITGVRIGKAGREVQVMGGALRKESVVQYAKALGAALGPLGVTFASVEIRPADRASAGPGDTNVDPGDAQAARGDSTNASGDAQTASGDDAKLTARTDRARTAVAFRIY